MKRWLSIWIIMALATASASAAMGDVGLSVKVGTLGLGADLTVGLGEKTNVRLSANGVKYTYDDYEFDEDEAIIDELVDTVEATIDFFTVGALLDWHPGGGTFRLSGGVYYNANEGRLSASADDTVSINNEAFKLQSLDGVVNFNTLSPYVGLGWGNAAQEDTRWHFSCDLGVLIQGSPDISIKATASDQELQDNLNAAIAEEIKEVDEDVDPFVLYPVVTLGLSYTF
ncbi:MAG: hypothetical protein HN919_00225 [Verrucomicrobia bacterium]|jgi:hypothetical protein|nr:hypothetical protein [Verrucomicrobiota bacterium]MBT7064703.1 hypothetical protein [Verrucomicrobiota bacterium]MBT7700175.1 hypothetical protein [Verrucomicrobiota bacterium]